MKRQAIVIMAAIVLVFSGLIAHAQEPSKGTTKGTTAEATAMVDKAIAHIKRAGREKAFADFSDKNGPFVDRDLYVVVYDLNGKVLAHGANSKMIGKDLIDLRDSDGKYFVKERVAMMSKAPDAKGWQDYQFMNPVSRQIEPKTMFLQRYEDIMIGCGVYKSATK